MDLQTIQQAIKQIALEKNLSEESITETINSALAAAYRKDFGNKNQNIIFEFDAESGKMKVYDKKIVVDFPLEIIKEIDENGRDKKYVKGAEDEDDEEEIDDENVIKFNPKLEILLEDAKKIKKTIKVGDELIIPLEVPEDFGRMAAQTAKQVIIQKIREAERENLFNEFKNKEKQLVVGVIQRRDMRGFLVDLVKTTALLPFEEQIKTERYNPGDRMKFLLVSVDKTIRGPELIVSRSAPEMIKRLFETEIPEIAAGSIEIMAIAREAGGRSKVAVKSNQESIDPIGSCVGQRGARIQTIINEIGGEKIDIIEWDSNIAKFITNALSPANVNVIEIDENEKIATVAVNEEHLSLAIGKEGQNVRLAAKLTGWKINILKETASGEKEEVELAETVKSEEESKESEDKNAETLPKKKKLAEGQEEKKKTAPKTVKKESGVKEAKKSAKKETKKKNTSKEKEDKKDK